MIKNVIFDIDGTISTNGNPVSENICLIIDKLKDCGVNICFASARPYRDIIPLLPVKFHKLPIVGCNGGMLYIDGMLIKASLINTSFVNRVVSLLDEIRLPYLVDGTNSYFISERSHPFHDYVKLSLGSVGENKELVYKEGVTKILILDYASNDLLEMIHEQLDINCQNININIHSTDSIFDITPANVNKFDTIVGSLHYDIKYTAAFGNDHNDMKILENVAYPFIVGDNLQVAFKHTKVNNVDSTETHLENIFKGLICQ
jgi:Cof subfamily protein (haloacid dehalogenase superfamily)